MRIFILCLTYMVASTLCAQESIYESSSYIHGDRFNEIKLTNSMESFALNDGSVMVSNYLGNLFHIKNSRISPINEITNKRNYVEYVVQKGDSLCLFANNFISVLHNGKNVYFQSCSVNSHYFGYFQWENRNRYVYFENINTQTQEKHLMRCDLNNFEIKKLIKLSDSQRLFTVKHNAAYILDIETNQLILLKADGSIRKKFKLPNIEHSVIVNFQDYLNYHFINEDGLGVVRNGKISSFINTPVKWGFLNFKVKDKFVCVLEEKEHRFYDLRNDSYQLMAVYPKINTVKSSSFHKASNSIYVTSSNEFFQVFPHVRKYPRLFSNSNSQSVFSLHQDTSGTVHAGSYNKCLASIIDQQRIETYFCEYPILSQGTTIDGVNIVFIEGQNGVFAMNSDFEKWKIADSLIAFCALKSSKGTLYLGTFEKGLWYVDSTNLGVNKPINWKKKTNRDGLKIQNILSMAEDKFGNIWMVQKGVAVFNPTTEKINTWHVEDSEKYFGSICVFSDHKGIPWFGSKDGKLLYYSGKKADDINFNNFKSIDHPFFKKGKGITFLHQWQNYLIIGASDRLLLFDLGKFYESGEVLVRYFNPRELNLTDHTEQNTVFTDFRDSSVWFATSDMVYQLDMNTWMQLPTFKVYPSILLKKDSIETSYKPNQKIILEPTENSIQITIDYQTPDNLPRFISATLVKNQDSLLFDALSLENTFRFENLSSGDYKLFVQVCQQDGSVDIFEYPIKINLFLWQNWWFWAVIFLVILAVLFFIFKKQNDVERTKRKVSVLNLTNLSNQFRPHFMLNALNSIGSQLEDKPHAEKVISRLGESINLLYGYTQSNTFIHSAENEWLLAKNMIEIQRLLYLPDLELTVHDLELLPKSLKLPIGLIQIPVENALLHGLRNKLSGTAELKIEVSVQPQYLVITISDNGIGRAAAGKLNKEKNHGNGLNTVHKMIEIINGVEKDAVAFEIIDLENSSGTVVIIKIKKVIDYGKLDA